VQTLQVRRAQPADARELTRLRAVMFAAMGSEADDGWRTACEADLREQLAGDQMAAFVVDAPDGSGLACSVIGTLDRRLPGPGRPGTNIVVGHVSSMVTDPGWRRRGMARVAMQALLEWLAIRGAVEVRLSATAAGEPLYRSLGFSDPTHRALRLRLAELPRAGSAAASIGGQLPAGDAQP